MPDHERVDAERSSPSPRRSPFRSTTMWLALVVTIAGAALWVYAAATAPEPPAPPSASSVLDGSLVAGLNATDGAAAPAAPATVEPRLVDRVAPYLVRLGPSFMAGFFLAWAVRRSVKLLLLAGGAAALLVFGLKQLQLFEVDWNAVEAQMDAGIDWAKANAEQASGFARTLIPSAGAGVLGMFFGARYR